jgi:diadenylate cyclase
MRFPQDIIDILVIAFVVYKAIEFLRETRAGQLVKGIIMLFVIYAIADWLGLAVLEWTLSKIVDSVIIVAAVIFQPELRRILERVGRTNFKTGQLLDGEQDEISKSIDCIARAAGMMQDQKIGALIVFERKTQLGEIINTGTVVDAVPSVSVVNNIFFPKSPLHDGAMIVRDGRIYAAGCILPLTQRTDISSALGTRHRAAIGMTENSDAVVLVVSEETGIISIVSNGQIKRNFNSISASVELNHLLLSEENVEKDNFVKKVMKLFTKKEKGEDKK